MIFFLQESLKRDNKKGNGDRKKCKIMRKKLLIYRDISSYRSWRIVVNNIYKP